MGLSSRENTVYTVLLGGVGAAAAVYLARRVWYRRERPKVVDSPLRVGIVGTGWGIKVQLPQFRHEGLSITALYSRSMDRAITLAAEHHVLYPFDDVAAICRSDAVDLVSIVTPCHLHADQFIDAMEAGKHVLVDKPLCLDGDEGERMLAAVRAHPNQVAVVDHELRFTPMLLTARRLLREGVIGPVRSIEVAILMPGRSTTAWDWWSDAACGGGMAGAVLSHVTDALRFMLDAEVGEVSAALATTVKELPDNADGGRPRAVTADDYASIQYRLVPREGSEATPAFDAARLVNAHATAAICGDGGVGLFHVGGTRGSLKLDIATSSLAVSVGGKPHPASLKGIGSAFRVVGTRALATALQDALGPKQDAAALEPACTLAEGLETQYVLDAARQSSSSGGGWVAPKRVLKA